MNPIDQGKSQANLVFSINTHLNPGHIGIRLLFPSQVMAALYAQESTDNDNDNKNNISSSSNDQL
jgi:hypothetical protein